MALHDSASSLNPDSVISTKALGTDYSYKREVVWRSVAFFIIMHILAFWGLGVLLTGGVSFKGYLWGLFIMYITIESTAIGAHRYYSHRSFKATPFLRAVFILAHTAAGQKSMFVWCRDHRLHHRYSDTDADPHNAKRGFFFSHIGWLMMKKHPYVTKYGKTNDLSDLEADWMLMFQKKYYVSLHILLSIVIVAVPPIFFGDTWKNSFLFVYCWRYIFILHATFTINSFAHMYGPRPYDKNIQPTESWILSLLTHGEGWHNYHHAFPWDYKTGEFPINFNLSACVIRFFEKIGLAYDLKSASENVVNARIIRTGDGTHCKLGNGTTQNLQ